MLLALDIGNTNINIGVFESDILKATWRMSTDQERSADEYGLTITHLLLLKEISSFDITAVSMCSVVPPLTDTFVEVCQKYFRVEPLIAGIGVKSGIRILYDNPRDVGADRIADAAAALHQYGGPVIVVDFGTAIVFDGISKDGEYLGGAISPGISIAANALFHSTSQLRRIELHPPPVAIGRNTIHALQSGLFLGYIELVNGMVSRFNKELGGGCKVVATGGMGKLFGQHLDIFDAVDPNLTLLGLRIIHQMNT